MAHILNLFQKLLRRFTNTKKSHVLLFLPRTPEITKQ